jgi:tetratricopeptide (TPR) repeat protein
LLVALWRIRIERSVLWAAALVFVVALTPVLGFVRFGFQFISQVADHYVYLSMLGAALAVAWLISRRPTATSLAAGCLVVFALGARSMGQASVWRSDFTLFEHAIEVNPDSSSAWYHLGFAQRAAGHDAAAISSLETAIRLDPDYWEARWHLGGILLSRGEKDQAIVEMRRSLAIRSALAADRRVDFFGDQVALGDVLVSLGRFGEAAREYRAALALRPQDAAAVRKLRRARQGLRRRTDDGA